MLMIMHHLGQVFIVAPASLELGMLVEIVSRPRAFLNAAFATYPSLKDITIA
jgi:hypothetical protein